MGDLVFRIPVAPSVNELYYNAPGKGRRKTERYRGWFVVARNAMRYEGNKARTWPTIAGPAAVEIICNPRGDIDNRLKGTLDLLVDMSVIKDDSLFHDVRITRGGSAKEAIVTVRELTQPGAA